MKFFIVENNQQAGPFTLEEMAARGVTPSTPVWHEGMSDWTPAGNLPELASLFAAHSPSCQTSANCNPQPSPSNEVCPKTWLAESILITLFCCIPFGIVGIVKASSVSSKFSVGDFAGARRASADAKKWVTIGLICGIVGYVLYFLFIMLGVFAGVAGMN